MAARLGMLVGVVVALGAITGAQRAASDPCPAPGPTATPTITATPTGTGTPVPTASPTASPTPCPAPTETPMNTPAPTATPTPAAPVAPASLPTSSGAARRSAVPRIAWRHSRALGKPFAGRLVNGVQLPAWGEDFITWDPVLKRYPDRPWRRWGTDRLIRTLLRVTAAFRLAHPSAQRVVIGDLSRPHGGPFGRNYGGLGHSSHQNGLDADVYYPRRDGREEAPRRPADVDTALSQDLLDRFLAAGAVRIFVGPHLRALHGPRRIVSPLVYHDDHMHVRLGK